MSIVALAIAATLAGHTSLTAVAKFGRLRGHKLGHDHLTLDGKVVRGRWDVELPGIHLLAADAPQASAVIARITVTFNL